MFNRTKSTDRIVKGYNTTSLNRQMIIRFRSADGTGYSTRSKLITARQLVEMTTDKAMATIWDKLNSCTSDKLTRKIRGFGSFEFVWR